MLRASLVAQLVKNPSAMQEAWVPSLGREDPLEKGKATRSSILAWRIPRTEKSMGSQSGATEQPSLSLSLSVCYTKFCNIPGLHELGTSRTASPSCDAQTPDTTKATMSPPLKVEAPV